MRKEISETQHWRTQPQRNSSWSTRRRSEERTALAAEVVDAAFAEEAETDDTSANTNTSAAILSSLTSQLTLLEAQREHLQKLLAQAKNS